GFDVVHFELAPMAGYAAACALEDRQRPLLCLDEHNIEYEIARRTAEGDGSVVRRLYNTVEWRKVRREERHAWTHLDGCTVTSVRDQELLLSDEPSARTAVVPNGVDLEHFRPRTEAEPGSPLPGTLLFFGAIDYYPNTDAVLFFLEDVFPRLIGRYPGLRFSVVGRQPPESVLARRCDHVEITGLVDDVRPRIQAADVVVVPLRIGGGTRLKILEAMAMGKAVVSTTLGAEGLGVVGGRELLLADEPEAFAAQVARLLDDPLLARRIGDSARQFVASRFSWKGAVETLRAFYGELLEARAAAA
ncbi:MAG TPA: glycosyltransferase, partial [Polyangiaceae bacterium]